MSAMAFAERLCIKSNQKWGPAACHSKANKEARLMGRKVLVWMLATVGRVENRGPPVQRSTSSPPPTPDYQGARPFRGQALL